jgi:hypothetical protein
VLHDPSMAAPLRLIAAGLDLHKAPFTPPPYASKPTPGRGPGQQGYTTQVGQGVWLPCQAATSLLVCHPCGCGEGGRLPQSSARRLLSAS